jgi:hypothetical protein
MTETLQDVLEYRIGKMVDAGLFGGEVTSTAENLASELDEKFISFPVEELDRIDVVESANNHLYAGPLREVEVEAGRMGSSDAYNMAEYWLAMHRHLLTQEQQARAKLAQRPQEGLYRVVFPTGNASVAMVDALRSVYILDTAEGVWLDRTDAYDSRATPWYLTPLDQVRIGVKVPGL